MHFEFVVFILTVVSLATFSWTYIQTSEDIPAGESKMTRKKDISVKPSKWKMLLMKAIIEKNYYQQVFHVLCITCASFDPNQHQPFGHLKVKEENKNIFQTLRRADPNMFICMRDILTLWDHIYLNTINKSDL